MPPLTSDQHLARIADLLGMTQDDLLTAAPQAPPADWLFIDGAPGLFEIWADQVLDPGSRRRLLKIAAIMKRPQTETDDDNGVRRCT